ncbi:DUF72 domain-containing protein [Thermus sediminis]|uniref:DUF72 domain-containing protein n=1 Tax=Thermus sediminis TaxID=1761908 RepID=UPI001E4280E9|nr:DUF72 domain-containing protein [Thermus sediminis]
MKASGGIQVGLQGYWGYPGGFKAYRQAFPTVELSWWHRLPDEKTLSRLRALAPEGFLFSAYGHKHLTYRPSGEERHTLRRFLRRFKRLGEKRGAVRLLVPQGVEEGAFSSWLDLLEEVVAEIGPTPLFFQAPEALRPLLRERGYALVNGAGPFLYLLDPPRLGEGKGFAYFSSSQALAQALHS